MIPKFDECETCRFFSRKFTKPQCRLCGCGEFFEPRTRDQAPSDNELMKMFEENYDE